MTNYILQAQGIYKHFGGVQALKGIDFRLRHNSIHAVLGENGAGKSTLMKIILGFCLPDRGAILLDGQLVRIRKPLDAINHGISMIYQELHPVPHMSVAGNIFLGCEPSRYGIVNFHKMNLVAEQLLQRVGLQIDPQVEMGTLSLAQWQMIEIAKALNQNARIIIMDEPTSSLSEREVKQLFFLMKELKNNGIAIIYISHKLDEIYEVCEEVTVLRDGNLIATRPLHAIEQGELVQMMVGQNVEELYPHKTDSDSGQPLLKVSNLSRQGEFSDISFSVNRGEILGITGLVGSGRTELLETIYGIRRPQSGSIEFAGKAVNIKNPRQALALGMAMVPEDRKVKGLILGLAIGHNILLSALAKCLKYFWLNTGKENQAIKQMVAKLQIKTSNPILAANSLSGGNQQKVVFAKALWSDPELIILDEPTRGIDIKTKKEIYALMADLASRGRAVLIVSSEIPEIIGNSSRIILMAAGRMVQEWRGQEAQYQKILELAMRSPTLQVDNSKATNAATVS